MTAETKQVTNTLVDASKVALGEIVASLAIEPVVNKVNANVNLPMADSIADIVIGGVATSYDKMFGIGIAVNGVRKPIIGLLG